MNTPANEWRSEFDKEFGVFLMPRSNMDGKNWEDEVFPCEGGYCTTDVEDIKDFIQNLLEDTAVIKGERRRIVEQIREEERAKTMENTFILTDSCMWEANKQNGTRSEHCIEVVDEKTGQVRYIATGSKVKFIEGNISEVHTQEKYNEGQTELDQSIDIVNSK